jgi:hypothetical protein
MDPADAWRMLFENWPESIPRNGLLITTFQEQIPFTNYLVSPGILLLDRDKPDSMGARKVMVSFAAIAAVKITNTLELARFQPMGFQQPF